VTIHEDLRIILVVLSLSSCLFAPGFCGESTSLPLEKYYILAIKCGLTKKQFQVHFLVSEVSNSMDGVWRCLAKEALVMPASSY